MDSSCRRLNRGATVIAGLISASLPAIIGATLPYLSLWLRPAVSQSDPRRQDVHWARVGMALIVSGLVILDLGLKSRRRD